MKNYLRKTSLISSFLLLCGIATCQVCPVIPMPVEAEKQTSVFQLNKNTTIVVSDNQLKPIAYYLQKELLRNCKIPLSLQVKAASPSISLALTQGKGSEESYSIAMNANGIRISADNSKGVFYGVVSLLQMITQSTNKNENIAVNCWNIKDAPIYSWRGLMLDESRHFFGKEKVKSILDWMAFYKLNRFHWHLTDEPAWRLEIKKYPLLTLVGGIGSYTNAFTTAKSYSQEEIKEIINYAAERQIVVIPEIDMPGHASAANRAYPQFSGGGSDKHPEFTFNPGKEETYNYLTDILRETNALFPGGLLHLGGDEVSFGNDKWMADESVKKLMKEKNLASIKEVERYFMKRMADSVYKLNAKLLAWDEVAEMSLPSDKTIVFWWRHEKPEQLNTVLKNGYSTVLCPRLPLYFDFVQDSTHTAGRKWVKQYNSNQEVYSFNVAGLPGVTSDRKKQIIGIQANVWTETIHNEQRLDYMLFPRIAALAEAAWTSEKSKNYEQFKQRLVQHSKLYKLAGLNFYKPE